MDSVIYDPLKEYEEKYKVLHYKKTIEHFESLLEKSGVNWENNRRTVKNYLAYKENIAELKKKYNLFRVLRVLMIITLILIPVVIWKTTPKIRNLRSDIETADEKADKLKKEAEEQMAPLNGMFSVGDSLKIIEETLPLISFCTDLSAEQEEDMRVNYDFCPHNGREQSTLDILAGRYNGNPFLVERRYVHTMGTATYHGEKVIHWTETYRDSEGRLRTRMRSETLHASVTKPKPYYSQKVVLNYCAQGAPELSFSRDATHLEKKSERQIERYVKKGEKRLKKKEDKALSSSDDFVSMSNTDFEVLFDALDRTNEVQFRTLFTPLAQTNIVKLILSKTSYGDDFNFIKRNRTNQIISEHAQARGANLFPSRYYSHSYDEIRENFINGNVEFFKSLYFDFAPLWAIPVYQERPVHSLKPIPPLDRQYSVKEYEILANALNRSQVVHPATKTQAILSADYVGSNKKIDEFQISAFSYDIEKQVDYVSVYGGDGRFHNVPVPWDEYLPLEAKSNFFVSAVTDAQNRNILAARNNVCIFKQ